MDVFDAIKTRRTIKKFTHQPVEFDKLARIIEAGTYAPSAGNMQNWRFIVVTDKPILHDLYQHCLQQEAMYNATAAIIVVGVTDKAERLYGLRGKRLYTVQNCAAAIQNMLLAAHTLGLGACWIGAFDEDKINSVFSIPDNARPQAILALGYPDETPGFERKDLESVTYFNQYKMKIKDFHRLIKDYSVEWQRKAINIEENSEKSLVKLKYHLKRMWDKAKENHKKRLEKGVNKKNTGKK